MRAVSGPSGNSGSNVRIRSSDPGNETQMIKHRYKTRGILVPSILIYSRSATAKEVPEKRCPRYGVEEHDNPDAAVEVRLKQPREHLVHRPGYFCHFSLGGRELEG